MASATIIIRTKISLYLFLLLYVSLSFKQTQATRHYRSDHIHHHPEVEDSLVLSLVHARTSLLTPKSKSYHTISKKRSSKPLEIADTDNVIIEPLREIRDGYLISLTLGTPQQVIQVYMDTGSDLTWVPCGSSNQISFDCQDCQHQYQNDIVSSQKLAAFSPTHSSTSVRETCSTSFCIDIHSSDNSFDPCTMAGCSLATLVKSTCSRPCPSFAYTYGANANGVVVGTLTRDAIFVHGSNSNSNSKIIPMFCFGCVGSTYREPIGIAGFGRGLLSLPSQLGFSKKGFSHCFLPFKFSNNPNFTSPLILGNTLALSSKDDNLQFTPLLKTPIYPNYYYVGLESITINNGNNNSRLLFEGSITRLREFDRKGNGGMLIDSGTTYTHLPEPLYSQLLSYLMSGISYPRAKQVEINTGFDLCYKLPCDQNKSDSVSGSACSTDDFELPSITFHFLNNVTVVLPQENNFYIMEAPSNSTVVKCLLFQSMDDGNGDEGEGENENENDNGPAGIFGSFQQQNLEVVYDLEKERIGFQARDCLSAAASHGLHKKFKRNFN